MNDESLMPERDEIWAKHDGLTPALAAEMLAFAGKMEMERNKASTQHDLACIVLGITTEHDDGGETLLDAVRALLKDRNEWKEEAELREKKVDVWEREVDLLREQLKEDERCLENNIEIFVDLKETINKAEDQLASERALADQLAAIIQLDRDGWGGMLTEPRCSCEDCEYLRVLDAALDAWKEARK
jgi:septal ring factor EnvC (AmiA/AmiB activator)